MENRIDARKKDFKKAFDDPVRRRETAQVQIRKAVRETHLAKKRVEAVAMGPSDLYSAGGDQEHLATIHELPSFAEMLSSDDYKNHLQGVRGIRKLLSVPNSPPISAVVQLGVVPRLVQLLYLDEFPDVQFEAAWALTNIASGSQQQTQCVIAAGGVPPFVRLLRSPNFDVRDQSIWAIGNIAGDSAELRNAVLEAGALDPLLEELKSIEQPDTKPCIIQHATWTLSNFCRGRPPPTFEHLVKALPVLKLLLRSTDVEILSDACWALSYLSDATTEKEEPWINAIIKAGLCGYLVDLLSHSNANVQTPALRAVGNICTGNDQQTQTVLGFQCLPKLKALLDHPKPSIQKEACWTISNITAGTYDQIEEVIANGIIPDIVRLLNTSNDNYVKREAAWAISNAASGGNTRQIAALVEADCLQPLVNLLDVADTRIMRVGLEAIENILRIGKKRQESESLRENPYAVAFEDVGGVDKLDKLQRLKSDEIQNVVVKIIMDYFDFEPVGEEEPFAAPSAFGGMP